jgi:dTDP-4-dehydrorhamnose 3,5-epimerase
MSAAPLIHGVRTKVLRPLTDERGWLMEILRRDEELFLGFGQVYVTTARPGVVKAWHAHRRQTDHFVCLGGSALVALYDDREGSPTRGVVNDFVLGEGERRLVQIPPLVWHGFTPAGSGEAMILNLPTEPYAYEAPDELRRDPFDPAIPYRWQREDG